MYISRRDDRIEGDDEQLVVDQVALKTAPGLRWSMLLRSVADPKSFVSLAMWQTQQQATECGGAQSQAPQRVYDVMTARGSMTPAKHVALVGWALGDADRAGFTDTWNGAFHHIEDSMGSRLLQDVSQPDVLAGLHSATADGQPDQKALEAGVQVSESLTLRPLSIEHFEVVSLIEP